MKPRIEVRGNATRKLVKTVDLLSGNRRRAEKVLLGLARNLNEKYYAVAKGLDRAKKEAC